MNKESTRSSIRHSDFRASFTTSVGSSWFPCFQVLPNFSLVASQSPWLWGFQVEDRGPHPRVPYAPYSSVPPVSLAVFPGISGLLSAVSSFLTSTSPWKPCAWGFGREGRGWTSCVVCQTTQELFVLLPHRWGISRVQSTGGTVRPCLPPGQPSSS